MRILITGAKGMMGGALCDILTKKYSDKHQFLATDIQEMDIRDRRKVEGVANDYKPEIIFHLAALTNVDDCEKNPDHSYETNTVGSQNVALVCQTLDIPMVYVSTLSVFDGTKPDAYIEFDTPNPQSHYSRSKFAGEQIVQSLLSKYYIARAGWMFGGGKTDKKFVAKIIELAQKLPQLKVVDDKFGSPVYTYDISQGILHLIETGQYGLYHMVNTGDPISRYIVAKAIVNYAGIKDCELLPVSSAEFPLPAPRPRMEAGRNLAGEIIGLPKMRPWNEALKDYIETTLLD